MKQTIVIFSFLAAATFALQAQVASPATGGGTQVGTGAVAPAIPVDRTPGDVPPTPPVIPPSTPVIPQATPVTPPGLNPVPGQGTPPVTPPGVSPSIPGNPEVTPTFPGTLPPGAGTANRRDIPALSRRTNVPPTLLRNRTNITPAQRAQINRLANDLAIFRVGAQLGAPQKNQLMNSLAAASNTGAPVSLGTLGALADHLASALSSANLTPQQRHQLAIDLNMLLYSSKLAPSDTQMVIEDARNLLQSAGVNAEGVNALTTDFATISRDLQAGSARTTSSAIQTQP